MEDPALADGLRVAGNLPPVHRDVVAPLQLRPHPQPAQIIPDRAGERFPPAERRLLRAALEKGKIDIPQIVVYRPAPCQPAHHRDPPFSQEGGVHLGRRVLVHPDDYRRGVPPQENHLLRFPGKKDLLHRQVVGGIGRGAFP